MNKFRGKTKITQVWPPVLAIAAMALSLAVVLLLLGVLGKADAALAVVFTPAGLEMPVRSLGGGAIWMGAALLAVLLTAAIFHVRGTGRRVFLWLLTFVVTLAWAPVLVMAAFSPGIAAPLVVVIWAGICAIFYTSNHDLPVDLAARNHSSKPSIDNGPR